jgi:hypothetical protein
MGRHGAAVPEGPSAQPAVPVPRILVAAIPINLLAGLAGAAAVAAGAPGHALAAIAAGTGAAIVVSLLTIRMIRRMRLVEERRRHVRFQRNLPASLSGYPARVTDLSLGGASLIAEMTEPPSLGSEVELTMELATGPTRLRATVRRALERGYFARMGVEFAAGQRDEIIKLGMALLHSDVAADAASEERKPAADGALARVA